MKITEKNTMQDMSLTVSFIASERQTNESFEMEQLSPRELDSHSSKFLLAVRKKNGDEFEPTTLRSFCPPLNGISRNVKTVDQFCRTIFRHDKRHTQVEAERT